MKTHEHLCVAIFRLCIASFIDVKMDENFLTSINLRLHIVKHVGTYFSHYTRH